MCKHGFSFSVTAPNPLWVKGCGIDHVLDCKTLIGHNVVLFSLKVWTVRGRQSNVESEKLRSENTSSSCLKRLLLLHVRMKSLHSLHEREIKQPGDPH